MHQDGGTPTVNTLSAAPCGARPAADVATLDERRQRRPERQLGVRGVHSVRGGLGTSSSSCFATRVVSGEGPGRAA